MKLTKKNQELVAKIAHGFVTTPILAVFNEQGEDLTPELVTGITQTVSKFDTTELERVTAQALSDAGVDFKVLSKVDKFLSQPETQDALMAVQHVNQAVQPLIVEIARAILVAASEAGNTEEA